MSPAVLLLLLIGIIESQDALYLASNDLPAAVLALTPLSLEMVDVFNANMLLCAQRSIQDLRPGLKHHSLHCLSFGYAMPSVIGLSLDGFGRLFTCAYDSLKRKFPRSPDAYTADEWHRPRMSRRFSFFDKQSRSVSWKLCLAGVPAQ